MTEPWAPPPGSAPATGVSRLGCGLALVALFLAGFAGVGAVLLLRAPDGTSSLDRLIEPPSGYVPIDDATSGGGTLSAARAASLLGGQDVPGFRAGVLRAWGRPAGEPPRAVVVLVVEVGSPAGADELRRAYAHAALTSNAKPFPTPAALRASGFTEPPDAAGRSAQRVAFSRGPRVFVVSVVTPEPAGDTAEVVALATAQAAALDG